LLSALYGKRLSWGSRSPSAPSDSPATYPEISLSGIRPRLRFLTAFASLHPAIPFQAYFILEALLGFSLQGVPLRRSALGLSPRAPLVSFPRWPPFPCAGCLGLLHAKAGSTSGVFTPSESVRDDEPVRVSSRPFPSWASSSLGILLEPMMEGFHLHLFCTFLV
jgi:hypothetical protein